MRNLLGAYTGSWWGSGGGNRMVDPAVEVSCVQERDTRTDLEKWQAQLSHAIRDKNWFSAKMFSTIISILIDREVKNDIANRRKPLNLTNPLNPSTLSKGERDASQ